MFNFTCFGRAAVCCRLQKFCTMHTNTDARSLFIACKPVTFQSLVSRNSLCASTKLVRLYSSDENKETEYKNKTKFQNPSQSNEDIDIKTIILDQALEFVELYGWSRKALSSGAEAAGYAGVSEGMFKNGGSVLALHFVKKSNSNFKSYLEIEARNLSKSNTKPDVTSFLRNAIEYRLRMIIPFINVWPQAMTLLVNPSVVSLSMEELVQMIDEVWYHAGDTAVDSSWYTKRALLTKLYASTQLVMLTDQSPDFRDTWDFLQRRLDDMESLSKFSSGLGEGLSTFSATMSSGYTVLRNVTGFGDTRR